ncbi:MAG TPA: heme exporter protein CcmB [Geminicoccus sp.]|uniref:heme exporter protein CcmB n=1 Tax=Geminicoccus sp. TaxID=2024832 RepID=UPI002E30BDD3|nr:heme exporter protein CcmB [Geminicoccus sp.]HEX2526340.1 heme exporter protein CcmB [Geminicoccus sp.]
MSTARAILALARRDLTGALRRPGDALLPVLFLITGTALFPLGVGPGADTLARIGTGVIWVLALFAITIGTDRLWAGDVEDGSLETLALSILPLEVTALVRTGVHWLVSGLPIVLASPLLALLLQLEPTALLVLPAALLLGTPVLVMIGGIGAALLVGSRRSQALTALLVLPLQIPTLIFGVGAVEAVTTGVGGTVPFLVLGALLLATAALAPFATAAALRLALE